MNRTLGFPRTIILAIAGIVLLLLIAMAIPTDSNSVCESVSDQESCANPDGGGKSTIESASDKYDEYEPPSIEWCRRRPTWRMGTNSELTRDAHDLGIETDEVLRKTCRQILNYAPDADVLTEVKFPMLSSTWGDSGSHRYQREWNTEESEEDDSTYYQKPVLERPLFRTLGTCLDLALAATPTTTTAKMKKPTVTQVHRRKDGRPVMAIVEHALSEEEAQAVWALSRCIRRSIPALFEHRSFEFTYEGGGNDVTYLAGFLQLLAPGVAHRILTVAQLVWNTVGWARGNRHQPKFVPIDVDYYDKTDEHYKPKEETDYSTLWWPNPMSECGIRTSEHLSYERWKGLGFHEDGGSEYTILVALSDPQDYEGGHFSLCPDYDTDESDGGPNCLGKISVKPPRLSAIVFLSDVHHGVEDIRSPGRVMFANELWRYGDVPAMIERPTAEEFVLGVMDDDDDKDEY